MIQPPRERTLSAGRAARSRGVAAKPPQRLGLRARSAVTRFRALARTQAGEVAERLKAPHSKCGILARVSRVRIPPSPPRSRQTAASGYRPTRDCEVDRDAATAEILGDLLGHGSGLLVAPEGPDGAAVARQRPARAGAQQCVLMGSVGRVHGTRYSCDERSNARGRARLLCRTDDIQQRISITVRPNRLGAARRGRRPGCAPPARR